MYENMLTFLQKCTSLGLVKSPLHQKTHKKHKLEQFINCHSYCQVGKFKYAASSLLFESHQSKCKKRTDFEVIICFQNSRSSFTLQLTSKKEPHFYGLQITTSFPPFTLHFALLGIFAWRKSYFCIFCSKLVQKFVILGASFLRCNMQTFQ